MINDQMLGDMGFLPPALVGVAVPVIGKIFGGAFGPTEEFQRRQAYRDEIANMLKGYIAALPELPSYLRSTVAADIKEMERRVWREGMRESDYIAALTWFQQRIKHWETLTAQPPVAPVTLPYVPITTTGALRKPRVLIDPSTGREVIVSAPVTEMPPVFKEAGLPSWLPIALVGGLLFTAMKKKERGL